MGQTIEINFAGRLFYRAIRLGQLIQSALPLLAWWVVVLPLVECVRHKKGAEENDGGFSYRIDSSKRSHRMVAWSVFAFLRVLRWFSGMVNGDGVYRHLLTWNPKIPVLGYTDSLTIRTIEYLGRKYPDGSRGWDVLWITKPIVSGQFVILEKSVNDNEIDVRAVWISGRHCGKAFTVTAKYGGQLVGPNRQEWLPIEVYVPPAIVIFITEMLLSAGILLSIMGLADRGWEMLERLYQFIAACF